MCYAWMQERRLLSVSCWVQDWPGKERGSWGVIEGIRGMFIWHILHFHQWSINACSFIILYFSYYLICFPAISLLGCFSHRKHRSSINPPNPSWPCTQFLCLLLWDNEFSWEVLSYFLCYMFRDLKHLQTSNSWLNVLLKLAGPAIWLNKLLMRQLQSWTPWVRSHTRTAPWSCSCWETTSLSGPPICLKMEVLWMQWLDYQMH